MQYGKVKVTDKERTFIDCIDKVELAGGNEELILCLELFGKLDGEKILKYLKNAQKGLKGNNVEEVQWWFGDIFEILCEQKEIIDPLIYQELIQLNKNLKNAVGSFLLVYTTFKKKKELENEMNRLVERIESRLQSLQMYISSL